MKAIGKNINGKEIIRSVFAGVGNPINVSDWFVEILNFAKRYADANVTNNPKYGSKSELSHEGWGAKPSK